MSHIDRLGFPGQRFLSDLLGRFKTLFGHFLRNVEDHLEFLAGLFLLLFYRLYDLRESLADRYCQFIPLACENLADLRKYSGTKLFGLAFRNLIRYNKGMFCLQTDLVDNILNFHDVMAFMLSE